MTKALILDDQTAYIHALARALRSELDIVGAETQANARTLVDPEVSIALVDICLDETVPTNREGLAFIRWLRAEQPDMKIIAMSARDDQDIPQLTREAGADVFLSKPLRISELKRILGKFRENSK